MFTSFPKGKMGEAVHSVLGSFCYGAYFANIAFF
jgi:hypothetical protein